MELDNLQKKKTILRLVNQFTDWMVNRLVCLQCNIFLCFSSNQFDTLKRLKP